MIESNCHAHVVFPLISLCVVQYVYAHFPINLVVSKDNKVVEVKNYLGEKMERVVELLGDTTAKLSKDIDGTKDEITIQVRGEGREDERCSR